MKRIQIKRIYEDVSPEDGYRILVDRLWPRGISKDRARLNDWNKAIAPSTELRKWFGHQTDRFEAFSKLYKKELENKEEELNAIRQIADNKIVTLLYGARDPKINHAIVLQEVLNQKR